MLEFFISVAALSLMAIRYPRTRRLIATATAVAGIILTRPQGVVGFGAARSRCPCDIGRYIKSPRCEVACPVGGGCDCAGLRPWPGRCHLCGGQGTPSPPISMGSRSRHSRCTSPTKPSVAAMPNDFTREYLTTMLQMRAKRETAEMKDRNSVLHTNQSIAINACDRVGRRHLQHFAMIFCTGDGHRFPRSCFGAISAITSLKIGLTGLTVFAGAATSAAR